MIAVRPGRDGTPAHWRLTNPTMAGADLLASAPMTGPGRVPGWHQAIERLRDADGTLRIAAGGDGHYVWLLTDAAGAVIAQSPTIYRDADTCRRAFALARRAARSIVGGNLGRPAAVPVSEPAHS